MAGSNFDESPGDAPRAGEADIVAQLIRSAGRRVEPPAEAHAAVLAAATAAWQAKVRARRRRRVAAALAASMLIGAVGVLLVPRVEFRPAPVVAHTDAVQGDLQMRSQGGAWSALSDAEVPIRAGTHVRTADGSRAGLLLGEHVSLRLAGATDIVLESSGRLRLLAGRIYLDTGATERRIEVITPAGTAVNVGTQFEVSYRAEAYRLRVRQGRVVLSAGAGRLSSAAGEQLLIAADGSIERHRITAQDAAWQWAESVAPVPELDGRPLEVLLDWVRRETGRPVRFESANVELRASATILHGSIRRLAPLEALSAMLAATDLEHRLLEDGTILIRLRTYRQSEQ